MSSPTGRLPPRGGTGWASQVSPQCSPPALHAFLMSLWSCMYMSTPCAGGYIAHSLTAAATPLGHSWPPAPSAKSGNKTDLSKQVGPLSTRCRRERLHEEGPGHPGGPAATVGTLQGWGSDRGQRLLPGGGAPSNEEARPSLLGNRPGSGASSSGKLPALQLWSNHPASFLPVAGPWTAQTHPFSCCICKSDFTSSPSV